MNSPYLDNTVHRTYSPNREKVRQLLTAGFVATLAMLAVGYLFKVLTPIVGTDFATLYGSIFNGRQNPATFSGPWIAGLVWTLITGTILFPFVLDYLASRNLIVQDRWAKGALFSATLWLISQVFIRPMAGDGMFAHLLPNSFAVALIALVCWEVYGLVLDGMQRVRVVPVHARHHDTPDRRHAA